MTFPGQQEINESFLPLATRYPQPIRKLDLGPDAQFCGLPLSPKLKRQAYPPGNHQRAPLTIPVLRNQALLLEYPIDDFTFGRVTAYGFA